MKTKQAFSLTVLIYFLVPGLFIAFNFNVDPFGRYHPLASNAALEKLAASKNEVLVTEYNYNDRLLTKNFISVMPGPGLVLFGGSRISNVGGDVFTPDAGRVLNAHVTAASIRDHIGLWQILKEENKIPRRVFVFLDLQSFYSNSSATGWYSLSRPFLAFKKDRLKKSKYRKLASRTLRRKAMFHLDSLSSSDVLKKSWERFTDTRKNRGRLVEKTGLDPKNAARTPELALIAPEASEEEKRQSLIDQWAADNGRLEAVYMADWGSFSEESFEEFSMLLEDMKTHQTEVTVLIMPSHPLSFAKIGQDSQAIENLKRFKEKISQICGAHNAALYDGLYEHHADVKNADFKDGVHLKKEPAYVFISRAAKSLKISYAKQSL